MPAAALSRVVESGPGGQDLAAGTWQRLEALPDPRSPQGRIYPLACLVAIAICAFTAAGNDRFTAVGQWIRRASQAGLARLRAPWDPITDRYRVRMRNDPGRTGPPRPARPGPGPARPRPARPPPLRRPIPGRGAPTAARPAPRKAW